jgi:hypothetical protein
MLGTGMTDRVHMNNKQQDWKGRKHKEWYASSEEDMKKRLSTQDKSIVDIRTTLMINLFEEWCCGLNQKVDKPGSIRSS